MAARKLTKRRRTREVGSGLAEMSVDQFMADVEGSDDESLPVKPVKKLRSSVTKRKRQRSEVDSHGDALSQLAATDPDFFQFLKDNDQELLQFTNDNDKSDERLESDVSDAVEEGADSDSEDSVGVPELRPMHVTSHKEVIMESDEESSDSGDKCEGGESSDECVESVGGRRLTREMVVEWVESVQTSQSLRSVKQLTNALHSAIAQMLHKDDSEDTVSTPMYHIESASVFNLLVLSCLKHVEPCLSIHLPPSQGKSTLSSSHKAWPRVKRIIKPYLSDLHSLIANLRDPAMQCAVIRNIRTLTRCVVCLPRVCKGLEKQLIECWACGDHHVQVMAFLALRDITLIKPHPSLGETLKKLYLAFVRNCKFTSAETLPRVRFMENCLVELLSLDTPTTYQLGFVYIRQLAIHLRAAITSGKKDAQQAVYNWQFVHCLDLWGRVLGHLTDTKLRPLVYPLVQVVLGTVSLQPSPRYYPLRLHLTKTLIELGQSTDTFIPSAPFLLEVLENCGANVSSKLQTGKPPDLSLLLRATKTQLQSRAYQSAVLNGCFEQLVSFSAAHSHLIGYPELMFPIATRVRRVAKTTPYSWLRLQLQQLLAKVDEVAKAIERERERVEFSPSQIDQVSAWEASRRGKENAVRKFQKTWTSAHATVTEVKGSSKKRVAKKKRHPVSDDETSDGGVVNEDVVEDFDLSSADSD
ncbi:nucleolar complex protein 2 homolog [Halichondria panicea]|uniref:nucleolar complex protein 2 homolog n=1 Tax=Halichondria panicea TaxID=6063 RepID=UPI00312B6887